MALNSLEAIAAEVQRLSDIEAIKQLEARSVRMIDLQEWDKWGEEVLTQDSELHTDGGSTIGRDKIVANNKAALKNARTAHRLHVGEVTFTGPDTAMALWPMDDDVEGTFGGVAMVICGHGYYHDECVRTKDGWRIQQRRLVRQWVHTEKK